MALERKVFVAVFTVHVMHPNPTLNGPNRVALLIWKACYAPGLVFKGGFLLDVWLVGVV